MRNIDVVIKQATEFVLNSQDEDGMWYNFLTRHHGESADWVSSFTGLNLLGSGVNKERLELTASSILKRQRENGGFSYNHKIVPDADSTAFAIRFLSHFGYQNELDNARQFLEEHQDNTGGFRTYQELAIREYVRIPPEMSVAGWCLSIPDITASALLTSSENESAVNFLLKTQQQDGRWSSYWWTSDVYSTVHSIEALSKTSHSKNIGKARDWVAQEENVQDVPFYLALSIQALVGSEKYQDIVKSRTEKLLSCQREDGSWNTEPILQFPSPSNVEPWNDSNRWREDAKDQNRIFTTSSCILALERAK